MKLFQTVNLWAKNKLNSYPLGADGYYFDAYPGGPAYEKAVPGYWPETAVINCRGLALATIVRRFLGNFYIVSMAFFHAGIGDLYELRLIL